MRVPVPLRAAAMGCRQRARSYLQAGTQHSNEVAANTRDTYHHDCVMQATRLRTDIEACGST